MAKPLSTERATNTRGGDLIASALRTLEAGSGGITALSAAIHDGLGTRLHRRGRPDLGRARPADRDRHGQVRPCRAQDRGDVRLDRDAGLLRASERSEPRRPRHDHARRRHHGAVLVGRDRRAQGPDRLFAPLPHRADRRHRRHRQHARARRRRGAGDAAGARGLPAQSRPHHLDPDAGRARRRAGDRALGEPRLHRRRLRPFPSRRPARRDAQIRARHHAYRRRDPARQPSARACRKRSPR